MKFPSALIAPALTALCLAGCMRPPAVWCAAAGSARFAPCGEALAVRPLKDLRPAQNENPSWLGIVPLVLWTTETDHLFEWVLSQPGSRARMMGNAQIAFDAENDLPRAMQRQLERGGLFAPVFTTRTSSVRETGGQAAPWRLQVTLHRLALRRVRLHYGLGPLAFVAYALCAPVKQVGLELDLHLALCDGSGQLRYERRIVETAACHDGWYRSHAGEQRVLDWLAFKLSEALDAMMQEASGDIAQPAATGPKGRGE